MDKESQIALLIKEYKKIQQEIRVYIIRARKQKKQINQDKILNEMIRRRNSYELSLRQKYNYAGPLDTHAENEDTGNPKKHKLKIVKPKKPQVATGPESKPESEEESEPEAESEPELEAESEQELEAESKKAKPTCEELKEPDTENRKPVSMAGDVFYLSYSAKAKQRRKLAFTSQDPTKCLTDGEKKLLEKINIVGETLESVKPYLAEFFESLPNCSTSVQMMTSKDCQIPNYIMWSVLLKARQSVKETMEKASGKRLADIEVHQKNAQIKTLMESGKKSKLGSFMSALTPTSGCNKQDCEKIAQGITRIEALLKSSHTDISGAPDSSGHISDQTKKSLETKNPVLTKTSQSPKSGGALEEIYRLYEKLSIG